MLQYRSLVERPGARRVSVRSTPSPRPGARLVTARGTGAACRLPPRKGRLPAAAPFPQSLPYNLMKEPLRTVQKGRGDVSVFSAAYSSGSIGTFLYHTGIFLKRFGHPESPDAAARSLFPGDGLSLQRICGKCEKNSLLFRRVILPILT